MKYPAVAFSLATPPPLWIRLDCKLSLSNLEVLLLYKIPVVIDLISIPRCKISGILLASSDTFCPSNRTGPGI